MQKPSEKLSKLGLSRFRGVLRLLKGHPFEEFQTSSNRQKRSTLVHGTVESLHDYQREVNFAWLNAESKKSAALMEWQKRNNMR